MKSSVVHPNRLYTWLACWIRVAEELTCVLSLVYFHPHWSIDFWGWYHRVKWTEMMKEVNGK